MPTSTPKYFKSINFPTTNIERNSAYFRELADLLLTAGMQVNTCVDEMEKIENDSTLKEQPRENLRQYGRYFEILSAFDSSDWADLVVTGIPECRQTDRLFPAA